MDLWNNEAGRRLGDNASGPDALARDTYAALRRGDLVTGLTDPRLRQLYPDDPRLSLPGNDPQRELVTGGDVDRINRDASRVQDQSHERFPTQHPDRAYFDALRGQLPASVSDTRVAQAMLAGKEAGIERVEDLAGARLMGNSIHLAGNTPGFRAQVDLSQPAPEMRDSVYQADQHNAVRSYDEQARQQQQPVQTRGY